MNDEIRLPDKLSELCEVALEDVLALEKAGGYGYNPDRWVYYPPTLTGGKQICEVCLAGSVMVRTLGVTHDVKTPDDLGHDAAPKLRALDYVRMGLFFDALDEIIDMESWTNEKVNNLIDDLYFESAEFESATNLIQLANALERLITKLKIRKL